MSKPYEFSRVAGIIYKRERPENRWKKVRNMIPNELAKRFLQEMRGMLP